MNSTSMRISLGMTSKNLLEHCLTSILYPRANKYYNIKTSSLWTSDAFVPKSRWFMTNTESITFENSGRPIWTEIVIEMVSTAAQIRRKYSKNVTRWKISKIAIRVMKSRSIGWRDRQVLHTYVQQAQTITRIIGIKISLWCRVRPLRRFIKFFSINLERRNRSPARFLRKT